MQFAPMAVISTQQSAHVHHDAIDSYGGASYLLVLVLESMLYDVHQRLEVWQHSTTHEDGYLLHNLDACVTCLPTLLAQAHSLQEGQQGRDAQRTGNNTAGANQQQ